MRREKPIQVIRRWKIVRGDKVMVIAGKEKNTTGIISKVFRAKNKVFIQGKNLVKKHVKKTKDHPGMIITKEAPIHVSNVQLLDPVTGLPTRVNFRYMEDLKQRVRISVGRRASGSIIPKPVREPRVRVDGGPRNTLFAEVMERTYDVAAGLGLRPYRNFFEMRAPNKNPMLPYRFRDPKEPHAYFANRDLNFPDSPKKNRRPFTGIFMRRR